jgi:hypothetical protein
VGEAGFGFYGGAAVTEGTEMMASRDEIRIAMQFNLRRVVTGEGPSPRPEPEMRAIVEWIDKAVDAMLLDPDCFEGQMLRAMLDKMFTIESIEGGEPKFVLTEYGRAHVDSMPHDTSRITKDGIR